MQTSSPVKVWRCCVVAITVPRLAAERRFKLKDGPRVLVCTAAGREGINLQFARILFNFDLPWNPMDMEQRIGRIHRYGQNHTAQVYNLVLSDTIEGAYSCCSMTS
jgi:SNF2 family DNA or RNA helicase